MKKINQLVIGLACCIFSTSYAVTPQKSVNYSSGLGSPITTATAEPMEKGGWGMSQRTEYYPSKPLSNQELIVHPDAESQNASIINYLLLSYGLGTNLTIGANLPYIYTSNLRAFSDDDSDIPSVSNLGSISGVSDLNVFTLWRFFEENKYPVSMALLTGINAPTGKTTERDREGNLFSASDQPSSGAWVPFAGLIFTKKWDTFSLSTNLIYTQSTEGAQNTTMGSLLDCYIAAVIQLYETKSNNFHLDGVLELNAEHAAKNKTSGLIDFNSGSTTLFFIPGFRLNVYSSVSLYLGGSIPVVDHYNGIQVKDKIGAIGGIDFSM